jgi:DNA-binding LytR/AlgR family response regulator
MSDAYSILIADAEDADRARLRDLLDQLKADFPNQVVGEAAAGGAALSQISTLQPQAVLLDAQLPDMSGIELARQMQRVATLGGPGLGSRRPALIFVAGSRHHALDAFEVDALDYLLKPVDATRLLHALRRLPAAAVSEVDAIGGSASSSDSDAISVTASSPGAGLVGSMASSPGAGAQPGLPVPAPALPGPPSLLRISAGDYHPQAVDSSLRAREPSVETGSPEPSPKAEPRKQFCVHERGRVLLVPLDQVIYLKAELKYVTVRTRQREYLIEDSLTAIEAEFGDRFVRIHRNALVARSSIAGFERVTPGADARGVDPYWQVVLRDVPERLQVSRRQWSHVRHLIG